MGAPAVRSRGDRAQHRHPARAGAAARPGKRGVRGRGRIAARTVRPPGPGFGEMSARASSARASGRMVAVGVLLVLFGLIGTKSVGYLGFVGLALLPTLAAAIVEKPGRRSATVSIGSMTGATLLPLVLGAIANSRSRKLLTSLEAGAFLGWSGA